eukprot:CAMPEP_0179115020 /NCGR_PEP_ID=MMETSP0796-20121207/53884_1 /TAXON_ID=73915 /ORGANISM="Pyrodinium bahamense, Strain pbaha01" /LENGTH=73 /DNA_ID=CAMNT_0020813257 /DNA_START=21 /DNA_END=243 /DNA_ORIENTATION=-
MTGNGCAVIAQPANRLHSRALPLSARTCAMAQAFQAVTGPEGEPLSTMMLIHSSGPSMFLAALGESQLRLLSP